MPKFTLTTTARRVSNDLSLAEAIGTFELSAVGADESSARELLIRKLKEFLSEEELSGTLGLHRRSAPPSAVAGRIEVRVSPPARSTTWQEAVPIPVDYVRWSERDDLHLAYAPQFQVMVFASDPQDIEARLEKNVRLVLARLGKGLNLLQLSRAEAVEPLRVQAAEVEVTRKSARQLAMAEQRESDPTETLKKVAEPLGVSPEPIAFEMEAELRSLAEALDPETRRSVLLVGPSGSGKTALVRELARRRGEFRFGATSFWSTGGSRLMAGPVGYGLWQERCQAICRELGRINGVLHLGNLSELVEVGKVRRSDQSVAGFLRPWIARGEMQTIAEVTPEELARIERQEPQLVAAFQPLAVPRRTAGQTARILEAVWNSAPGERPAPAEAATTLKALNRLHALHERYGVYSAKPGRAVRFLRNLLADIFPRKTFNESEVTERFSRETGMPTVLLDDRAKLDLAETEQWLRSRVIGQDEAVARVVDLIATVKARLARPGKPLASLLFIGPTGVGKTEMAKALAAFFFGSGGRLVRFDLNQFNDPASVQRLIGAAGAGEGLLTARIREQPFSVMLLDEFEKADASFFDLLLQILGEGRLTDAAGRLADFSNCVIVMTSNLGAEGMERGAIGFTGSALNPAQHFQEAVASFLRPEIFNRLDAIVPFQPLPLEVIRSIAAGYAGGIAYRHGLAQRGIALQLDPDGLEHLARMGLDPRYGARPLKRSVERELVVPLAEWLGENPDARDLTIEAKVRNGVFHISKLGSRGKEPAEAASRTASEAVQLRRAMTRLKGSPAFASLENQITFLRDLEGRLKRAKWKSPDDMRRIERLPELSRAAEEAAQLELEVHDLETSLLRRLYQKESGEDHSPASALSRLNARRRELQYEIYEASLEAPELVIVAIYSEDKPFLVELTLAYGDLAEDEGQIAEIHYFLPTTRAKGAKSGVGFTREKVREVEKFFGAPPSGLLGVVLHLKGKLFVPKFSDEAGLHTISDEKATRLGLVETAVGKLDEYQPPRGFELQGFIHSKTAPLRRAFSRTEGRLNDSALGEYPWSGPGIERSMARLLEENLARKVTAATGGETD